MLASNVRAALYLSEPFDYPAANLSTASPWTGAGSNLKLISGNLTNSELLGFSPTNATKAQAVGSAADGKHTFSANAVGGPAVGGSIYVSFLLRQTTLANSSGPLLALSDVTTVGSGGNGALVVYLNKSGTQFQIGVKKNGSAVQYPSSGTYAVNDTVLVVARYAFNTASTTDDTVTLWVNPILNGVAPAPGPAGIAETTVSGGADYPVGLQYLHLRANSSTASGINEVDNIRVGSTWAEVTPADGVTTPDTSNEPRITQSFLVPAGLVLRGTNGTASGVYQVLSAASIVTPITNWPPITTNLFDANGNFDSTNPVSSADAQRFYRILVGGTLITPTGTPPQITTQPTNVTVFAGQTAFFSAAASGTAPLAYQWFFNTNNLIASATSATLTLTNAQSSDAGMYSLRVTNSAGAVTSAVAVLMVNAAPSISSQPASQSAIVSNAVTFSVVAAGSAPLHYQWYFNTNTPIANATNASFTITSVLTNNAGGYSVIVTNGLGSITSIVATLTVSQASTNPPNFGLFGFAQATTGGGQIPETDSAYVKVYTPLDFANAVRSANKTAGSVKVIEIMNDLNLGWNEVGPDVQLLDSNPFREHAIPKLHPVLITSGVSLIDIKSKSGLTIFSVNGATIRHANFNIKDTSNIIIRNLKFADLWEWDEATKGDYDANDWDFITIGNGGGTVYDVWIDHCTFTKAYDGICDMKGGCYNITFSWNKYMGDDGATNPNSFVRQQFNALEANLSAYPMYNFFRTHGFSYEDVVTIAQGHDKTHLIGATSLNSENAQHAVTFHHQWYMNPWDRLPRLRAGNVHNYNIYADDAAGLAALRLRNARVAAMSLTDQAVLDGTPTKDPVYKFKPFLNGSISTEDGAVLVENSVYVDCVTPLRNNQTDPSNPVYTGKILALDTIYHFDNADTTTIDYRGSSTNAPGNSYFGPVQATVKPFSWNGFSSLPYSYVLDDPAALTGILADPNYGAGAGVLAWAKTNWLKTAY